MFKKLLAVLLAAMMAFAVTACQQPQGNEPQAVVEPTEAPAAEPTAAPAVEPTAVPVVEPTAAPLEESPITAGEYTAEVNGHNGAMVVKVTMSEEGIEAIEMVSHNESKAIGDVAIEMLTEEIIERQSVNVDAIAGASVTSAFFLSGVRDALQQSGADLNDFMEAAPADTTVYTDETFDVIVVGAGGAGMAAALYANEIGLNTVLVEQLGILGGSSMRAGLVAGGDTVVTRAAGVHEASSEILAGYMLAPAPAGMEELYDEVFMENFIEKCNNNVNWLAGLGVEFIDSPSGFMHYGPGGERLGSFMIKKLHEHLDNEGVDHRLNTRAEELVVDETGRVTGVVLTAPNGEQ